MRKSCFPYIESSSILANHGVQSGIWFGLGPTYCCLRSRTIENIQHILWCRSYFLLKLMMTLCDMCTCIYIIYFRITSSFCFMLKAQIHNLYIDGVKWGRCEHFAKVVLIYKVHYNPWRNYFFQISESFRRDSLPWWFRGVIQKIEKLKIRWKQANSVLYKVNRVSLTWGTFYAWYIISLAVSSLVHWNLKKRSRI